MRGVAFDVTEAKAAVKKDQENIFKWISTDRTLDKFNEDAQQLFAGGALNYQAGLGNVSKCQALLKRHPNMLNSRNFEDSTPCFIAAEKGHAEVLKMLLNENVDANAANKYGQTPYFTAAF